MKAHVVLAHPEPKSFNAHLTSISNQILGENGYEVTISDLYAMDFDPREAPQRYQSRKDAETFHTQTEQRFNADNDSLPDEIEEEIGRLLESDLLVVHFPLWWFGMPAILKGWMDRVFVYGRMYRSVMRYDKGVCQGKKTIACVTTGASDDFDETKRLVPDASVYSPFVRLNPNPIPDQALVCCGSAIGADSRGLSGGVPVSRRSNELAGLLDSAISGRPISTRALRDWAVAAAIPDGFRNG